jgi:hypothetical protein
MPGTRFSSGESWVAHPSPAQIMGYFEEMGHRVKEVATGEASLRRRTCWVLYRPHLFRPCVLFGGLDEVWPWWKTQAAALLTVDTHFRFLSSLYRTATAAEREEMRAWATPPVWSDDRWNWSSDLVGHWRALKPEELPEDWPALARDVERQCVVPGERCRERFCRFIRSFDEAEERVRLEQNVPLALITRPVRRL